MAWLQGRNSPKRHCRGSAPDCFPVFNLAKKMPATKSGVSSQAP